MSNERRVSLAVSALLVLAVLTVGGRAAEPLDVFWIELVRSSGPIRWVKHQLATDLTMGIGPTIADVDADGDMDLVLRGHGIGGRYVIGARQTDVTLFIQNASVGALAGPTAKPARSVALCAPDSGLWVVLVGKVRTGDRIFKGPVQPQRRVQLRDKRGK